jgi:glycosyltransferase involved in cell wall biosynthesis
MGAELRVCLVVLELSVGGLERAVVRLANGLQSRAIPTRVIIMERNEYNTLVTEIDEEVQVFCLEGSLLSKALCLRKISKGHIIHLHFWGGHVKAFYRLALVRQRPVLSTYGNVYTRVRGRFWTFVDRLMSIQLRGVVAKSQAVRDYCVKTVGIPESKVHIIYNGVEAGAEAPRPDWSGRDLRLISVGRLVNQKDHETLIRGIAAAKQLGCGSHLTLIGDGPEMCKLVELASDLGVRDAVTWLGELWVEDWVRTLLRWSDVFVTASAWEGCPNAVLEAMSEGLPIIASDIEPHREVLAGCAVYFPPGDYGALGRAIAAVYRDSTSGRRLGEEARHRASLFSLDRMVDQHIQLYESIVTDRQK